MGGNSDIVSQMAADWKSSGLNFGDTVLVHSSLKRTFKRYLKNGYRITAEDALSSLLEAVGPNGTIILPIFNFDFASGTPFDIRNTPSNMGALTECGRIHPRAVRTGHPIYSFSVIGHHSSLFSELDNVGGYSSDSPFALLRELDGKIAVLGLPDQNSMTFYHHVEEICDVDYRYHKEFTGNYTGWDGSTEQKTYTLFVRKLEKHIRTFVNPMGEILWDKGLYSGCRPSERNGMRVISARDMFDAVSEVIKNGNAEGLLYRVSEEEIIG